jgi:hypothetical protein
MRQIGDHNLELSYFQDDEPLASPFWHGVARVDGEVQDAAVNKVETSTHRGTSCDV